MIVQVCIGSSCHIKGSQEIVEMMKKSIEENRLERIPNVSNYEIYIERIDEMLERKEKNLFRR